jgi:hypothetical protein
MFVISHFPDQPSYRAKVIEFRDRYEIQYLELVFFMELIYQGVMNKAHFG